MYQPAHERFTVPDSAALLAELCAMVPATLVSVEADGLRTSVLPMLFYPTEGESGILRGHLARANPHWRSLDATTDVIAIFNGPEAYVTPTWYEEKRLTGKVVPTWNYTTVVVHGSVQTHNEGEWLVPHVRQLVDRHETSRVDPWSIDDAPDDYIETNARAIIGLEMLITRVDAKRKLSQNRTAADVLGTIAGLREGTATEQAVAHDMEELPSREPS